MPFFRRADYRSEVSEFIDQLKTQDPALESKQRQGRALLWDKNVDRQAWRAYRAGQVNQLPYVYQTIPVAPVTAKD